MLATETSSTKMWGRGGHDGGDGVRIHRGIEQRDRAAVAMAEQHRLVGARIHAQRVEQRRQRLLRLAMHEIHGPFLAQRPRRRLAVAIA